MPYVSRIALMPCLALAAGLLGGCGQSRTPPPSEPLRTSPPAPVASERRIPRTYTKAEVEKLHTEIRQGWDRSQVYAVIGKPTGIIHNGTNRIDVLGDSASMATATELWWEADTGQKWTLRVEFAQGTVASSQLLAANARPGMP